MDDPYRILELRPGASVEEVRSARRTLAKRLHPDAGGNDEAMAAVNRAYERVTAGQQAESSFTLDVLPVDAFHALEVAVAESGEVLSADEPYGLEVFLTEPARCFCTIELVPVAGGTLVTVTVQSAADDEDVAAPSAGEVTAALAQAITA